MIWFFNAELFLFSIDSMKKTSDFLELNLFQENEHFTYITFV